MRRIAAAIRESGGYRWVGIYDVAPDEIGVIAWSGPQAPAFPRFPVSQGLCGASVRARIVVPVLDTRSGEVVGLLDVESDLPEAFAAEDRRSIEECAAALAPLWA